MNGEFYILTQVTCGINRTGVNFWTILLYYYLLQQFSHCRSIQEFLISNFTRQTGEEALDNFLDIFTFRYPPPTYN